MFKLKRPCANCPFKKGNGENFRLRYDRLEEIRNASAFQCHKTVTYNVDGTSAPGDKPQQCAGLMAVLHREGKPSTIMQVGQRLSPFDPGQLDPDGEAYDTWADVLKAHDARPPIVKGFTEFTPDELKRAKNRRHRLEMAAYNMRALRGDFDTY